MLKSLKTFMAERGHGVNKLVTGIMKGIRFIFLFREILFKEALFCLPQANPWEHLEDVFLWKKKKRENHARSCNKPRTSGWQSSELLNSLYAIPRKHQFPEKLDMKAPLFICWGGNTRAPSPEARGMLFVHGFLRDTSLDSQHVPQKHQWRGSEELPNRALQDQCSPCQPPPGKPGETTPASFGPAGTHGRWMRSSGLISVSSHVLILWLLCLHWDFTSS